LLDSLLQEISKMVKIFIGNLAKRGVSVVTEKNLRPLFEFYGAVNECKVIQTGYGFVHMPNALDAKKATQELDGVQVAGKKIQVRLSEFDTLFKIYVGNLARKVSERDLKALFVVYGTVVQCNVKTGFGFVRMPNARNAKRAIRELDGITVAGYKIEVQRSTRKGKAAGTEAGDVKQPGKSKNEHQNCNSDDGIAESNHICFDEDVLESSKAIIKHRSSFQSKPLLKQGENSSSTSELEVKFPLSLQNLFRGCINEQNARNDPSTEITVKLTNERTDWNSNDMIGQTRTICIDGDLIESTRAVVKDRKS